MTGRTGTAVVGYGYWGVNLARNVAASELLELVGVADADPGRRQAALGHHPGVETWPELASVLDDERVDAVVLSVPAIRHAELAVQALEAGRHVLVEKPLALSPADAERVVEVAEHRERVAMVGHTFLYSPPVQALKRYVDAGELGRIQYLYAQRLSLGRIRRDCNALWNFAPHDLSIMLHLLDEMPNEVSARGFCFIEEPTDDVCFASLAFPSGIGANLHVSWIDPRKTRVMTLVGDQKMAIYNDVSVDQKLWLVDAGVARSHELGGYESVGDFQWRTRAGDINIPHIEWREPLLSELDEFGRSCRDGGRPLTSARHGADVVRIIAAIDESTRRGGAPIELSWADQ